LESKSYEDLRVVCRSRNLPFFYMKLILTIRIVEGKIKYPQTMGSDAHDIIGQLCTVNPSQRLGNISSGGIEGTALVKAHPFFKTIEWDALYYRKMKGPIIPKVKHPADASNFDNYDPPLESKSEYSKDMANKYDHEFKDF
jgi:protein kinase A